MKFLPAALCGLCCLLAASPAHALSTLQLVQTTTIDNDGKDVILGEIADNSDTVIYLKKDSLASTSDQWSFVEYSLVRGGDSKGVISNGNPDVFYGFSPGPAGSVLYTRDAALSPGGTLRAIFAGFFNKNDSMLVVSQATYPAYTSAKATYNFAYVKDSDNLYVGALSSDTPTFSVAGVKIFDPATPTGAVRYPRWSADGQNLVFTLEDATESTASIYILNSVQSLGAAATVVTTAADSTYLTRLTADTFYNAFPHFVGSDQFVLYTRANPARNFKFSNFSDTGGCTSIILNGTNWDAILIDRSRGETWAIDTTATTAAVTSAANHRGYIVLVKDAGDTDGDITFSALSSVQNMTASSSGTFYFPTNVRLTIQAGAVPTCSFFVTPDTPTSTLRNDTKSGGVESVIAPVNISLSVPIDSTDKFKIEIILSYHDIELGSFIELATTGLAYDTATKTWKGQGGTLNTGSNTMTFNPPHFSSFGIGLSSIFNVVLSGKSCLVRRWASRPLILSAARRVRDRMMENSWGRRLADIYYAP